MSTTAITVTTSIRADVRKVWDCWTKPEHIVKWNFASDDWHCPKATNDLKASGSFSYTMASRDGKMSFDLDGVYSEVKPLSRLAYALGDGRKVTVIFEEREGQTTVTETFEPEIIHAPDMQRAGWQAILENFRNHVESL